MTPEERAHVRSIEERATSAWLLAVACTLAIIVLHGCPK